MILCWRRHGKAGGCQFIWGCSSVGRAPALQAGGQEFESLHLHSDTKVSALVPWKSNTEIKWNESNIKFETRHPRPTEMSENKQTTRYRNISVCACNEESDVFTQSFDECRDSVKTKFLHMRTEWRNSLQQEIATLCNRTYTREQKSPV